MKLAYLGFLITIILLFSCTKENDQYDFRTPLHGKYKVKNILIDCSYSPPKETFYDDTISVASYSDKSIILSCNSFVDTFELYDTIIPIVYTTFLRPYTFSRENYFSIFSTDSIDLHRGRYSYCRGGSITYNNYTGKKIK